LQNNTTPTTEPLAVRPAEAARLIRVSPRKFSELRASGALPPSLKIGGCVLYKMNDLKLWLEWECPNRDAFEAMRAAGKK